MTKSERRIRFTNAIENIHKVFTDYCKDEDNTREELGDFNDLIVHLLKMETVLKEKEKLEKKEN